MRLPSLVLLALPACAPEEEVTLGGGPVPLEWSGEMSLEGTVEIAVTEAVTVQPGTRVELAPGTRLVVKGALTAMGSQEAPVVLEAPDGWLGIELSGTLRGTYLQIVGAGGPVRMLAGTLDLTDSVLDLVSPTAPPDCTSISGGVVKLDHVRITGCHCPIHINQALSADVTDSVLDGAAVPVMLARTDAVFAGNDIVGSPGMQDVGSGITAEIGGNYWGGGQPTLSTQDPAQFLGADDWSATPIPGAGPR
jgi:hypothetical protein